MLDEEKVEYLVGGGYAVTFHGYPRYTGDVAVNFLNLTDRITAKRASNRRQGGCRARIPGAEALRLR